MATRVIKSRHAVVVSTTSPDDPDAIPAFEDSAGIKRGANAKPVYVNKYALQNFTKNVSPDVVRNQVEAANVAALFAKRAIRPDEIAALRRRMFEVVTDGLEDVAEVMKGTKTWNNAQVRLFSILTERVMPKLSTITVEDTTSKKLEDLSIEELEKIALGKKNHEAIDAVVKQGEHLDAEAEKEESQTLAKAVKGKMIKIASIDEAEKLYIEKKTSAPKYGKKKQSSQPTQPSSET